VRRKSVNILLCQQALVDLFASIFYSIGNFGMALHRDQTLVQQIKNTGITAWDTYNILCGFIEEPNATLISRAEFLRNLNETISSDSKLSIMNSSKMSHQLMIILGNFATVVAMLTTMLNFFVLVTDQWLAINHPFAHHRNVTVKKVVTACAFVWIFSLSFAVFLYLLWRYFSMLEENMNGGFIVKITIGTIALMLQTSILAATLLMLKTSYLKARRSIAATGNDNNQTVVARKQRRLIRGLLVMNVYLVVCILIYLGIYLQGLEGFIGR